MIRNSGVTICVRIEPDLVAASGLTVEHKSVVLQPGHNRSIAESGEAPISRRDYDSVVPAFDCGRQIRKALALSRRLDESSRNVARTLKSLGHCPSLRDKIGSSSEVARIRMASSLTTRS